MPIEQKQINFFGMNSDDSKNTRNFWKCKNVPKRTTLTVLGFLGIITSYIVRVNLNIALVGMVNRPREKNQSSMACPELGSEIGGPKQITKAKERGEEGFDWSPKVQGFLLAAVYYGYICTPFLSGVLVTKYGAKWIFGGAIFTSGLLQFLIQPMAYWNPWALFALRILIGMVLGLCFPAMQCLIGKWIPTTERSFHTAIIFNGIPIGTIITYSMAGALIETQVGWPLVFYVSAAFVFAWFLLWAIFFYESPLHHPTIGQKELDDIKKGRRTQEKGRKVPWKHIFTSIPVYGLAITHFCSNWGYYTLQTELPTYLDNIFNVKIKDNGLLSPIPYISQMLFSFVASIVADLIIQKEVLNMTAVRKTMNSIAMFGPAICLFIVPFLGCNLIAVIVMLALSTGMNGFKLAGFQITAVDLSPDFSGIIFGFSNTIATLPGILAPTYTGWVTESGATLENWSIVFYTACAFYIVAGIVYDVLCTAEVQPWGMSPESVESDDGTNSVK